MQAKKVEELPETCPNADTEPELSEESEIEVLSIEGNFYFPKVMQFCPGLQIVFIYLQLGLLFRQVFLVHQG